jgi:hypothetical protein
MIALHPYLFLDKAIAHTHPNAHLEITKTDSIILWVLLAILSLFMSLYVFFTRKYQWEIKRVKMAKVQCNDVSGKCDFSYEKIDAPSLALVENINEIPIYATLSEENAYLQNRVKCLSDVLVKQSKTLHKLKTMPKHLNEEDWLNVLNDIDFIYDNFTQRIRKEIPSLSDNEIRLCCLMKLCLPVPFISDALAIEPNSVSRQKVRLKKHILKHTNVIFDKGQTLDTWIQNF